MATEQYTCSTCGNYGIKMVVKDKAYCGKCAQDINPSVRVFNNWIDETRNISQAILDRLGNGGVTFDESLRGPINVTSNLDAPVLVNGALDRPREIPKPKGVEKNRWPLYHFVSMKGVLDHERLGQFALPWFFIYGIRPGSEMPLADLVIRISGKVVARISRELLADSLKSNLGYFRLPDPLQFFYDAHRGEGWDSVEAHYDLGIKGVEQAPVHLFLANFCDPR